MPRRPAAVTQADVARAIRAAKQEGWHSVRVHIRKDGAVIEIGAEENRPQQLTAPLEPKRVVML